MENGVGRIINGVSILNSSSEAGSIFKIDGDIRFRKERRQQDSSRNEYKSRFAVANSNGRLDYSIGMRGGDKLQ